MKEQNHLDGLEQELHDHIEAETGDNLARGMSPDRARQAARIKLGNISSIREEAYSVWHRVWYERFVQDVRFGLRTLRRSNQIVYLRLAECAEGGHPAFTLLNDCTYGRIGAALAGGDS
jgi:hypothetical protein